MQKVTNLGRFVRNRLPSAQSVPLCAVQCGWGGAWLRWAGCLLVGWGRGPAGDPPGYDSGWSRHYDRSQRHCVVLSGATVVGRSGVCWWCGLSGPGWCCTFILGCWQGWWRSSSGFPPSGTSGNRMNVQRRPRCTFILPPGSGPIGESAWSCHLLIAVCRKNVQLLLDEPEAPEEVGHCR